MPRSPKSEPDLMDPEEQAIDQAVKETPLAAAVLAVFTGAKTGRVWKVTELAAKLQGLGFSASRRTVTLALAQLETHLRENAFLPWILVERGQEWRLVPKSVILAAVENAPCLPEGCVLSEEEKAVLLVVIGYRGKGGVTKSGITDILGPVKEIEAILESLRTKALIYADPVRFFDYWRPRPAALLALHLRSHTEIKELKELELYFESRSQSQLGWALHTGELAAQRAKRRRAEQVATLPHPPEEGEEMV
jgi:hypothetical protein